VHFVSRMIDDGRQSIHGQPHSPLSSITGPSRFPHSALPTFKSGMASTVVEMLTHAFFVLSIEERVKEGFCGEFSLPCYDSFPVSSWKFGLSLSLDDSAYAVAFFSCSVLSISFLLCMLSALPSRTAKSNQTTNLVLHLRFSSQLRMCFHSFHPSSSSPSRTFS